MRDQLSRAMVAADNAKDLQQGRDWFADATNEDLLAVWMRIQVDNGDDAVSEIVSRLAQLKFAELYLETKGG